MYSYVPEVAPESRVRIIEAIVILYSYRYFIFVFMFAYSLWIMGVSFHRLRSLRTRIASSHSLCAHHKTWLVTQQESDKSLCN